MAWQRDPVSPGRRARGGACRLLRAARRGGSGSAGVVGRACSGGVLTLLGAPRSQRPQATVPCSVQPDGSRQSRIAAVSPLLPAPTRSRPAAVAREAAFTQTTPPRRARRADHRTARGNLGGCGARARSRWRSASCAPAGSTFRRGDRRARAARIRDPAGPRPRPTDRRPPARINAADPPRLTTALAAILAISPRSARASQTAAPPAANPTAAGDPPRRQRPTPRRLSRAGQGRTSDQPRVGRTRANGGDRGVRARRLLWSIATARPHL